MNFTERRQRLRALFAGEHCLSPASVWDPLSARVAQSVGFAFGMLGGSVASQSTLAAPDLIVLTLTELADQVRRIQRAADLSLMVDADHGYGNALNVMRTVEEVEHAGASGLTIEDTALPIRFGQPDAREEVISTDEMVGKLRAAMRARRDPQLVIAGRTSVLRVEGIEATIARAKAYAATGVDAIFVVGLEQVAHVAAIHAAAGLPIIVGGSPPGLQHAELAAHGVRILIQGHQAVAAVAKTLQEFYAHLLGGGSPADLEARCASAQDMERFTRGDEYRQWQREFLR
jgi:carboxyvinyl-carboxyphosphonate phosphorylmutase